MTPTEEAFRTYLLDMLCATTREEVLKIWNDKNALLGRNFFREISNQNKELMRIVKKLSTKAQWICELQQLKEKRTP